MNYQKHQFSCPVEATLFLIGGKYKPLILWHLIEKPLHYMELQRLIPKATPKMLSQQLRDLEECGMIHREVIPEKPPKTLYSLTAFGKSIIPVLDSMCNWGTSFLEDVLETIRSAERAEAAYNRRMYRYKAHYSLDCDNGIENAILMKPQTPEMLLEEKQLREQLYAAVMALPEKQAKRIYARYYLGMRVSEIAAAEGVDPSRVRDSIRRGLKQLAKYF